MALIKVSGNRFALDAHMVAGFEPDYMGWIFVPASPRCIPAVEAARLIGQIRIQHPAIGHVGVMGGMGQDEIVRLIALLQSASPADGFVLDALQLIGTSLHMEHTSQILRRKGLNTSLWPVLRVGEPVSDEDLISLYHSDMYVLDRKVSHALGGTGRQIELPWISRVTMPYLLAGGLNHENARERFEQTGARGVDISSGLETGHPGRKDPAKLEKLFATFGRA